MPSPESFRLRRSVFYQGAVCAVFFLVAVILYSCLFFLDNPAQQGFNSAHAAAILGGAGVALFGFMLLLSLYMILAYYVERVTVDGSTVCVRSVFQNHRFDRSEIQTIRWKIWPNGGAIRLRVFGRVTRLDLHGFARDDRLRIIRIVRALLPAASQEGWEMFCHKIALPLRDRKPADPRLDESIRTVLITRRRYDRLLVVLGSASVVVSVGAWFLFGIWQSFVLPLLVVIGWLLLRFNVPKNGRRSPELTSHPIGRAQLAGWGTIVVSQVLMIVLALAGFAKNQVCTIVLVFMIAGVIPMFFWLIRADRQQRAADRRGAETADCCWQRGESKLPAPESDQS